MELKYVVSESKIKHPALEVGPTTVYLRCNYRQEERRRMEGEEPDLVWVYDEAALSKDEALYMLAEQNSELTKALQDADGMNIDHEFRITMLELGITGEI